MASVTSELRAELLAVVAEVQATWPTDELRERFTFLRQDVQWAGLDVDVLDAYTDALWGAASSGSMGILRVLRDNPDGPE